LRPALENLLGPRRAPNAQLEERRNDIARSAQAMYEEAFFYLLENLQRRSGLTDIALAGGCAMNSVANGKVRRRTPFRRVYVQSAAGDAGGAIGSAFAVWHQLGGKRSFVMDHAYWGPGFDAAEVQKVLRSHGHEIDAANCTLEDTGDEAALCRRIAEAISKGQVIGWFQGRMEWGPRALGNRSILCDPRRPDMKAMLNDKIKAAGIISTVCAFGAGGSCSRVVRGGRCRSIHDAFHEEKRKLIPAITHVDGSGRLQTVSRSTTPRYHKLIETFRDMTGVPMVLNTSFNENEPVVCKPEEALDCFLRTRMDILVLGNVIVARRGSVMVDFHPPGKAACSSVRRARPGTL
jgi:carbamoyltransferase